MGKLSQSLVVTRFARPHMSRNRRENLSDRTKELQKTVRVDHLVASNALAGHFLQNLQQHLPLAQAEVCQECSF
jgi:hypothetical protein